MEYSRDFNGDPANGSTRTGQSLAFKMALPFLLLPRSMEGRDPYRSWRLWLPSGNVQTPTEQKVEDACLIKRADPTTKPFVINKRSPCSPWRSQFLSHENDPAEEPMKFREKLRSQLVENYKEQNKRLKTTQTKRTFLQAIQLELEYQYNIWKVELDRLNESSKIVSIGSKSSLRRSEKANLLGQSSSISSLIHVDLREFSQEGLDSTRVKVVSEGLKDSYVVAEASEESTGKDFKKTFRHKTLLKKNADCKSITAFLRADKILVIKVPRTNQSSEIDARSASKLPLRSGFPSFWRHYSDGRSSSKNIELLVRPRGDHSRLKVVVCADCLVIFEWIERQDKVVKAFRLPRSASRKNIICFLRDDGCVVVRIPIKIK